MLASFQKFFDVNGIAVHVVHLLQTQGATAIDAVRQALNLVKGVTGKDYAAVFAALNAEKADVEAIVAAVKAEFGLN